MTGIAAGDSEKISPRELQIAESVRRACAEAAAEGFQFAAMRGLCHEGAVEAAVSAVKQVCLNTAISAAVSSGE